MENALTIFEHESFGRVRTLLVDGEPWFVAKDVAKALGYRDTDQAIRNRCDDKTLAEVPSGERGVQSTHIIPEWDMYSLILGSRLPSAKVFKKWVCREVLPAIRKTGSYRFSPDLMLAPKLEDGIRIAKLLGYAGNHAILAGVNAVRNQFNVDVLELTDTPRLTVERQDRLLTPTEIGAPFGLSGHAVNRELEQLGLQVKVHESDSRPCWKLSEGGREYGCYLNEARSDTTLVRKIFWFPIVTDLIRERATQEYCKGVAETDEEELESGGQSATQRLNLVE
jgi:hypothetical protein